MPVTFATDIGTPATSSIYILQAEPVWLSKSPYSSPKHAPPWALETPRARTAEPSDVYRYESGQSKHPRALKASSKASKYAPLPAHPSHRSGRYSPIAAPEESEEAQFVRESLQQFEGLLAGQAERKERRERMEARVLSAQGSKKMATRPTSPLRQVLTHRQLQINALTQTKLVQSIRTLYPDLWQVRDAYHRHATAAGLDTFRFRTLFAELLPALSMAMEQAQELFELYRGTDMALLSASQLIATTGCMINSPERDLEIQYVFRVLDAHCEGSILREWLSKTHILSLKQAKAARHRWYILALQWAQVLEDGCSPPTLSLDDYRALVYCRPALRDAHDRLCPFHSEATDDAPTTKRKARSGSSKK